MVKLKKRQYDPASDQLNELEKNGTKRVQRLQEQTRGRVIQSQENLSQNQLQAQTQGCVIQRQENSSPNQPQTQTQLPSYRGTRQTLLLENVAKRRALQQIQENLSQSQLQTQRQECLNDESEAPTTPSNAQNARNSSVKMGRGAARFPKEWNTGNKLQVSLNPKGSVSGTDYQKYATALGCLARIGAKLPLNSMTFNAIPQYQRDMVWDEVQENTYLTLEAKGVVMFTISDIWRNWKSSIKKKYFTPYKDDHEFLLQPPLDDRIQMNQWLELVNYWKIPKVQDVANQNAKNVLKKECLHRTGRTSFSTLEEEMLAKGITDVTRLDVWMESRSRGKGIEDDNTTSDVHGQFTRELLKKPEEERTRLYKDELFLTAMGKDSRGHTRCAGKGVTVNRTQLKSMARHEILSSQDREELQKIKDELVEEKSEMKQMKEEFVKANENLHLEQEKTRQLNKKLELLLSQFPTFSPTLAHGTQAADAPSSHMSNYKDSRDAPTSQVQHSDIEDNLAIKSKQIVGDKLERQVVADSSRRIMVGKRVYLHCHGIPKKVVAEGTFIGYNANEGEMPIFCQICVTKALDKDEKLLKPRRDVQTIGQAVNKCISWKLVNISEA